MDITCCFSQLLQVRVQKMVFYYVLHKLITYFEGKDVAVVMCMSERGR